MARTLTTAVSNAVDDTVTAPRYLVELGWSTTVRLCTRETVTWSGYSWTGDGCRVESVGGTNADQRAAITLPNHDGAYGALALSEGLHDLEVKIYALYADTFAADDGVLLFDGITNGGEVTTTEVRIECVAMRSAMMYAPRIRLQPPLLNHAPAAGSTLTWAGDNYVLERR